MGLENGEINFFEEASSLIYKWLSEEERMQLHREFYSEEVRDITELEPELRLFRLLHFIQVKYIKAEEWVSGIAGLLETISSENPNFLTEDVIFKDANDEDVSLMGLREKFSEARPQSAFTNFLRQLELQEEFERYLASS